MASAKSELLKSADVCELAQLQPYVLRSWETEFPGLGKAAPGNTAGSGRIYRRADVELVLRIKELVFVEGLTLAGVRRRLEEDRADEDQTDEDRGDAASGDEDVAGAADGGNASGGGSRADSIGDAARTRLRNVRVGLEAIMELLDRRGERTAVSELQLVPPPSDADMHAQSAGRQRSAKRSLATARDATEGATKRTIGKRPRAS